MDFYSMILFLGKVTLVDIAVELLRQAFYAVLYNNWAKNLLHVTGKSQVFDWFLQVIEAGSTILLLALRYSIVATVIIVFLLTVIIKEVGSKILLKVNK